MGSQQGDQIRITTASQYEVYPCQESGNVLFSCNIEAIVNDTISSRAKIECLVVLDFRNSTDDGGVLKAGIEIVEKLSNELTPTDRLGLIVVDGTSRIEFPLTAMDDIGKRLFTQTIRNVRFGHSTTGPCITEGPILACKELIEKGEENSQCTVLYISSKVEASTISVSDLETKIGDIKTDLLGLETSIDIVRIFTVGLSPSDVDSKVLKTLARYGNGKYYACRDLTDLKGSMIRILGCLNGMLPTIARRLKVVCSPFRNCEIMKIVTSYPVHRLIDTKRPMFSVHVGDMFAGQRIQIILLVKMSTIQPLSTAELQKVLKFQVLYQKQSFSRPLSMETSTSLFRPSNEQRSRTNKVIIAPFQRATFLSLVDEANRQSQLGDVTKCKSLLELVQTMITNVENRELLPVDETQRMTSIMMNIHNGQSYDSDVLRYRGHDEFALSLFHKELQKVKMKLSSKAASVINALNIKHNVCS